MTSENLKTYLTYLSEQYYAGNPQVSDDVFDRLAESCGYDEVGAKSRENVEKHYERMYSLQKHYEDEGNRPLTDVSTNELTVSPKLDGAALSLLYVNGKLVRALTRGDGIEGQVVTDKFLATNLVPHSIIIEKNTVIQITGELVAPKHVENARNYAAGALNLKDVNEFKTRAVEFFAYGTFPYLTETFDEDMKLLKRMGFSTVKDPEIHNIYPCDGLVYRVNNNQDFLKHGFTAKHPRGAYALKERAEAVETEILDVVWQVGKSGKVTPVAILEPVYIGDKLVSRATLNNIGFIRELGICIGDSVGIILGGEVIPKVTHKIE